VGPHQVDREAGDEVRHRVHADDARAAKLQASGGFAGWNALFQRLELCYLARRARTTDPRCLATGLRI